MNPNPESTLLVGEVEGVFWIRVEGRGTFQNSPDLKAVAAKAGERGIARIVIDLQDCPLMDSTFMGTMTGLAIGTRGRAALELLVLNANERNLHLLESLGLDQIFHVDKLGTSLAELRRGVEEEFLSRVRRSALDRTEHAAHVLEAHEALAGANVSNLARFSDVVSFLKSEVEGGNPPA
jgi:anti-anti-sigma regulatory factor